MARRAIQAMILGSWGVAFYGLVLLGNQEGDLGHTWFGDRLCGPWGCMPPLQALLSLHGIWLLFAGGVAGLAIWHCSARTLGWLGAVLVGIGLAGIGLIVHYQAYHWEPALPSDFERYFPQRCIYAITVQSDSPFAQIILAGAACGLASWWKRKSPPIVDAAQSPQASPMTSSAT